MVDFYVVYDAVEEYGGWDHLTTNGDDGYCIWNREGDPRYQLVFYNWDTDYSGDPCGLRVDDTEENNDNGYYREVSLVILEGEPYIDEAVRDFLDEVENLI